jgi:multicomponent Na+:H+ antiporter subunit G
MKTGFTLGFMAIGALFTLLAAVGVLRLPDLFTRMQASTKSATLGVACMMVAALVHFSDLAVSARALLIVGALFLTAPVAAHAIGRAAYRRGVELWEGTVFDELREHHEEMRRRSSGDDAPPGDREGPGSDRAAALVAEEPARAGKKRSTR